jgi:hypothetical protein
MHVDQAGHEGAIAKVDDLGAGGTGDSGADFGNALTLNEDLPGRSCFPGFEIEYAGSPEDDRRRLSLAGRD